MPPFSVWALSIVLRLPHTTHGCAFTHETRSSLWYVRANSRALRAAFFAFGFAFRGIGFFPRGK